MEKRFRDHTVISVAHKLEFAAGFDRVVTMDQGRMVEFDRAELHDD
jgi:ABC-type transport system involved in cytochrome bd biosynthesis fused ATPase/permease subunit